MSLRELTAGRPLLGTFGPVDLSVDLGTPGQPDSAPMRTAAAAIEAAVLGHSVPMGIFAGSPQGRGEPDSIPDPSRQPRPRGPGRRVEARDSDRAKGGSRPRYGYRPGVRTY